MVRDGLLVRTNGWEGKEGGKEGMRAENARFGEAEGWMDERRGGGKNGRMNEGGVPDLTTFGSMDEGRGTLWEERGRRRTKKSSGQGEVKKNGDG